MWCGFQNHFYPLQDTEQRYPAPPDRVPPHWALIFTAVSGAKSDAAHPERPFHLVNDTTPKFCWLSWLHHHWLHWCPDPASGAGTARGRAESHSGPTQASRYHKWLQGSAPLLTQHTDSYSRTTKHLLSWVCKHSCQQMISCRDSKRLNNATLMNGLLRCESLVCSQVTSNKASAAPTSEIESRFGK